MKPKQPPLALSLVGVGVITALVVAQGQSKPQPQTKPQAQKPKASASRPVGASASRPRTAIELTPEDRKRMAEIAAQGGRLHKQARALLRAGKLEEAEQVSREAIAFYEKFGEAAISRQLLGDILLAKGQYEEALQEYAVLRRTGWSSTLHINMALCHTRLGDLDKAQEAYRDQIRTELGPGPHLEHIPGTEDLKSMEITLLIKLADVYSGSSAVALKYLKAVAELKPDDWVIAERIGVTLYRLKRYDEAIPYYRLVIQKQGDKTSYRTRMRVEMYDRQKQTPR